ncbi:hypothetical protein DFQ28_002670 [Apophysomyces sp. BC1034]|nr:hypothetical protein DFQ30_005066 [Apophysomyces sp. BC1015]KAG0179632.1 hypothetical protein DFQ29_001860 [Apophysomyces sp. BC1021]KAG0189972.1 hypothetical protein DFQ28_002670 [Apophysomyces sp. BC1034]
MPRIDIFTDNSPVSERNAKRLADGIRADGLCNVEIKALAHSVENAQSSDEKMPMDADAYIFSTTGALSVFEKHYFKDTTATQDLTGKKYGVVMSGHSTFDGPINNDHRIDHRLLERLSAHGFSHQPVWVQRDDDDAFERAGKEFAHSITHM